MNIKNILISLLIATILFVGYYFIVASSIENTEQRGQFGDMFGALNAFFTALAFFGLIYTIFQQNQLITKSKEQLTQSKKEFEVQFKIQALTTLINLYQSKLDKVKAIDHLQANEFQSKINALVSELEKHLLT
jgi:hypothetical protein